MYMLSMCVNGLMFLTFLCMYDDGSLALGFGQPSWSYYNK